SRNANRAHALRAELHDGDECPVCRQAVRHVPTVELPGDFRAAQTAVRQAREAVEAATAAAAAADRTHASAAAQPAALQHREAQRVAWLGELCGDRAAVVAQIDAIRRADHQLAEARVQSEAAVTAERTTREHAAALDARAQQLTGVYDRQRDAV